MMCPVKEEDTAWKLPPEVIRFTGRAGMPDIANRLPVSLIEKHVKPGTFVFTGKHLDLKPMTIFAQMETGMVIH